MFSTSDLFLDEACVFCRDFGWEAIFSIFFNTPGGMSSMLDVCHLCSRLVKYDIPGLWFNNLYHPWDWHIYLHFG